MTDQHDAAPLVDLAALAERVGLPDAEAERATRERQAHLLKPRGALGRLEELSVWAAGVQGRCPPRPFARVRVVLAAGDHGVTARGVSAYPPEVTAQLVRGVLAGDGAVHVLADLTGATVRVLDLSVDADLEGDPSVPDAVTAHKVRRGTGSLATEDVCTREQASAALQAGVTVAEEEVDAGADLLVPGDLGIGNTTAAALLAAAVLGLEPVRAVGRGSGVDDRGWAAKVAAVRDGLLRVRDATDDPLTLLARGGGPDLAFLTGLCLGAAARRTPVLLDGAVVTAAALVAHRITPRASLWWLAGHRSPEPSHTPALDRLGLQPLTDQGMRLGEASGALVALPLLQAAVATCARMRTFAEAGVSTATGSDGHSHGDGGRRKGSEATTPPPT